MLFFYVGLSYGGFQFDNIIDCLSNPHWELVISLLDSRNQTSLLLTICSIVLQRLLVSAIVW